MSSKYKRIILKISGESLANNVDNEVLDANKIKALAEVVKKIQQEGIELGIVIGAGNIFRGKLSNKLGIDRTDADYMGMLATVINCCALNSALEKIGVVSRVVSAIEVNQVSEPYRYKRTRSLLEKKSVVLFAGGTGNPYFTTDTCATLRCLEMNCDAILMAKNSVEGVYDCNPKTNKNAKFLKELTYDEVLTKKLEVLDQTAITMLRNHNVEIRIFNSNDTNNIYKVAMGDNLGSTIKEK